MVDLGVSPESHYWNENLVLCKRRVNKSETITLESRGKREEISTALLQLISSGLGLAHEMQENHLLAPRRDLTPPLSIWVHCNWL